MFNSFIKLMFVGALTLQFDKHELSIITHLAYMAVDSCKLKPAAAVASVLTFGYNHFTKIPNKGVAKCSIFNIKTEHDLLTT